MLLDFASFWVSEPVASLVCAQVMGPLQMLLVFFRAVVATRKRQDQGIIALEFAEPPRCVRVIGQLVVRKSASGYEIIAHGSIPFTSKARATGIICFVE